MHWPELAPVQGIPLISGSPPGDVWPTAGEFGTISGVHVVVNVSSISPAGQAPTVGAGEGRATAAMAGTAATATAKPPTRMSRRAAPFRIPMVVMFRFPSK